MEVKLSVPGQTETELSAAIREAVINKINQRGLSIEEVAQEFGLLPSGAHLLMQRTQWKLEVAVRAAEAVGIGLKIETNAPSE